MLVRGNNDHMKPQQLPLGQRGESAAAAVVGCDLCFCGKLPFAKANFFSEF